MTMTEYAKLTVVKLKELLKERSLPVSGNKAALVARLEGNDAESQAAGSAGEEPVQEEPEGKEVEPDEAQRAELPVADAAPTAELQDAPPSEEQATVLEVQQDGTMDTQTDVELLPEPLMTEPISEEQARAAADDARAPQDKIEVEGALQEQEEMDTRPLDSAQLEPSQASTQPPATILETPSESQQLAEPLSESTASVSQSAPNQVIVQHVMLPPDPNESSIDRGEVVEDTKKRKRRSQSPIPSSVEVATKKAKALDGSPRVTAAQDTESQTVEPDAGPTEPENGEDDRDSIVREEDPLLASVAQESTTMPISQDSEMKNEAERQPKSEDDILKEGKGGKTPPPEDIKEKILSPSRQSSNAKFKELFAATAPSQPPAADPESHRIEDRDVEPALHPATTALYVRNFTRPLQPGMLRDHLESLARPPSEASNEEEEVQEFFLDSIKTHCLVQFRSISAASRVRLALHDRVWPDERTRKALWADYVPEEKIKKWIEVEQEAVGRRGAPQKRFEVLYEQENGEAVAYLQEADGTGARGSMSAATGGRNGHAPTGPRAIAPPPPQGDPGKGFKQLDDLFKSTTAKPKLYFQAVSDPVAEKRLDLLAAGRGGGRSDEMRRFTFEDAIIVDKGPEYGSGWRGHSRGRGGYGRGYSSRGGYRGDSRRDSYR